MCIRDSNWDVGALAILGVFVLTLSLLSAVGAYRIYFVDGALRAPPSDIWLVVFRDLAFTAAGTYHGAITFGRHAWDNAAGAALVRAAGGIVTDVAGKPWTVTSPSLVAAAPGGNVEGIALIAPWLRQDRTGHDSPGCDGPRPLGGGLDPWPAR